MSAIREKIMTDVRDTWEDHKGSTILIAIVFLLVGVFVFGFAFSVFAHVGGIHEGTVVSKDHQDAYTTVQCNSYDGKTTICTPYTYPESWGVTISKDGEQNSFNLTQSAWDGIKDGYYLTFDGERLETVKAQ